jgi:hypothetical protein
MGLRTHDKNRANALSRQAELISQERKQGGHRGGPEQRRNPGNVDSDFHPNLCRLELWGLSRCERTRYAITLGVDMRADRANLNAAARTVKSGLFHGESVAIHRRIMWQNS